MYVTSYGDPTNLQNFIRARYGHANVAPKLWLIWMWGTSKLQITKSPTPTSLSAHMLSSSKNELSSQTPYTKYQIVLPKENHHIVIILDPVLSKLNIIKRFQILNPFTWNPLLSFKKSCTKTLQPIPTPNHNFFLSVPPAKINHLKNFPWISLQLDQSHYHGSNICFNRILLLSTKYTNIINFKLVKPNSDVPLSMTCLKTN
jgi:hypothetical protein